MERLWAPWRMAYIDQIPTRSGCFLCDAANCGEMNCENLVVWKNDLALCMLNRFPYNNGHLLVAPCGHQGDLAALSGQECTALFQALISAKSILGAVMKADGFNIGLNLGKAAGAGLEEHLHFHIVPRWHGDTNYMPVLADTKVIPQALSDLYVKLRQAFDA